MLVPSVARVLSPASSDAAFLLRKGMLLSCFSGEGGIDCVHLGAAPWN